MLRKKNTIDYVISVLSTQVPLPSTIPCKSLTFSYSYRLNSRTAMRENLKQSREQANDVSLPLSTLPKAKDMEGGVHVVSIFNPPHFVLPAPET